MPTHLFQYDMAKSSKGEYIYKGRKFNARKETTDKKYYNIAIYRFYIRCTRCSGEITFLTDPKNMDYECEKGAKRNFEPWRDASGGKEESEEERLDRLEREEEERNVMVELETKTMDAKREMQIADALDEIRTRNARNERAGREGGVEVMDAKDLRDEERERMAREDEEAARRAFTTETGEKVRRIGEDGEDEEGGIGADHALDVGKGKDKEVMPPPTFKRIPKKKKDFSAALGIKKKPSLV